MKKPFFLTALLFLVLTLAACGTNPTTTAPEPDFEVVRLQISPDLQHWLPKIAACADEIPNFGITTQVLPDSDLNLDQSDLILRLGDRRESDPSAAVMGTEEIVVVTNKALSLSSISLEDLQGIFTGKITDWNDIPGFSDGIVEQEQPITVLSYPVGNNLRQLFEVSYLDGESVSTQGVTFSTVGFLEELLQENPDAIGYLLKSQLPPNARSLEITGFDEDSALQYVLAVTSQEPMGQLRQLLLCVQE